MAEHRGEGSMTECPVCNEDFRQPKLLPCNHSYCLECLDKLAGNGNSITCPECRKITKLPERGTTAFTDNKHAEKLVKMKHSYTCMKHNLPLHLFCDDKNCQEQLCPSCVPVKHGGHKIIDLEDKANFVKKVMSNTRDGVREITSALGSHLDDLKQAVQKIEKDMDENTEAVDETKEELQKRLNELQQKIIKETQTIKLKLAKNKESMLKEVARAMAETIDSTTKFEGLHKDIGQKMANLPNNEIVNIRDSLEKEFLQMKVRELANSSYDVNVNVLKYTKPKTEPNTDFDDLGKLSSTSLSVSSPPEITEAKPKSIVPVATFQKAVDTGYEADIKTTMATTQNGDLIMCGKIEKRILLKCQTTEGRSLWGVYMGDPEKSTVKGLCCVKGVKEYLVVSVEKRIELRDVGTGELISSQSVDFDPGKVCSVDLQQNNFLIFTDQGKILNFSINEEKQKIQLNKKVIQTDLKDAESLTTIVHQGKLLVIAAAWFPESVIEAVQWESGAVAWKLTGRDRCDGVEIRPHGLGADNAGNLFVGDTTNERVLLLTPDGKVRKELIKTPKLTKCVSWDTLQRRLLVNYQSDKEMVGVYGIRYELGM